MTQSVESGSELGLPSPKERRRLREAADLTHGQVAAAVGVTVTTVRSWEAGRTDPRGRKRAAYAEFLAGLARPPEDAPEAEGPTPADPDPPSQAAPEAAEAAEAAEADPAMTPVVAVPAAAEAVQELVEEGPSGAADASDGSAGPDRDEAGGTHEPPAVPDARAVPEAPGSPVLSGAEGAFDDLYARAASGLIRQAYLLTGRRDLAQEAVERAFRQAWRQWPEVATDPDPVGWVRIAAYEYALSPWHQMRPVSRHPDKPPAEPADRILLDALLALPTAHRRTVLLYDGVGLDLPDTAAETEASTPTAGGRLLHAHADLADRVPELAGVPPEKHSSVLHDRLAALTPAVPLQARPAAAVRGRAERRTRRWTRAAVSLTSVIAVATAYTAATAPTHYEPPIAPGSNVSGVPPLSGPQQLTEHSRQLHDKLRADPAAGPARITPRIE
ncbi:helix-turn-helix domain-containing protein [Streptomyces sp. NBC_00868]|uniref:helix-turn-helix domain-containing protein n=1 Tax=unclassified Streptomyces TaxID=2593676 RepID=UPI00324FFDD0|nr:helix-turn-helix domain-containing protein [Streptomyces sp. NBC_00868]